MNTKAKTMTEQDYIDRMQDAQDQLNFEQEIVEWQAEKAWNELSNSQKLVFRNRILSEVL